MMVSPALFVLKRWPKWEWTHMCSVKWKTKFYSEVFRRHIFRFEQLFWPCIRLENEAILRLAVYMKSKNAKKFRHNIEYGSARWGTREDIEPYMDPTFKNNVILSQSERITMNSRPKEPKYARNKNVLVVGGSGSGKTRFFIKPNLLQMHSSYVVTDPKGYFWIGQ